MRKSEDAMDPTEKAIAKLEIAGKQYERDLSRDRVLEDLVDRLAATPDDDHVRGKISAHVHIRDFNNCAARQQRERAASQIVRKVHDPAWVERRQQRLQRHAEVTERARQLLGHGQNDQDDGVVYKTYENARPEPDILAPPTASEATMGSFNSTGFDSQQAASLSKILDQLTTIIAEETALRERQLRTEIKARFLELENKMLRAQLEKSGDGDVIDFDAAKSTVRRNAG